jgi:RNA polymerase sigma-70 factor (ECF subfamily)
MAHVLESRTGSTLLDVLQNPMDNCAWRSFVERYGPKISGWCRQRGLKQAGVEEVTQIVLVKLVKKLRTFRYDPRKGRFRGWLKVVTDHAVVDYLIDAAAIGRVTDPDILDVMGSPEARKDLGEVIEKAVLLELLDLAMERVQLRVSRRDWQIFGALALEERSAADVAEDQEPTMTPAAVGMVKYRVKEKVSEEFFRLLKRSGAEPREG